MPDFNSFTDDALHGFLLDEAETRELRLVIEARGDEWFAEFRYPNELGGEVVPMAEGSASLPDEGVALGAGGHDRRSAMVHLAEEVARGK